MRGPPNRVGLLRFRLTTVANRHTVANVTESTADGLARLHALNAREGRPTRVCAPWVLRMLATAVAVPAKTPREASTRTHKARGGLPAPDGPPAAYSSNTDQRSGGVS